MAFHNGELCLHYQPIHAIDSGRIVAFEALVRWNDPENGMRGAADVIPIAERSGLIVELGEWVLGEALRQSKSWRKQGGDHFFRVHVNVSPLQLDRKDLPQRVSALLESSGADPGDLILELTESQWLGNPKQVREQLNHIREWGIRVYLDDFGTGFSSLAYLQELPIDGLKLAGNFTRSLANGLEPNPIIRWVTRMGKSLGLDMIAEEVETDRQLEALRMLHVPLAQGFLLSPPLPAEEVALLMRAGADLRGRGPTIWRQPFFTQALELETFVDRDNLAGFMAAPDGRILSCTERLGRVLGLPSGAQPGEINLRSFFATPGDAERFFSGLARGGQLGTLVARFRTREGKPFWAALSATVSTVADAEPQLTGTLVPLEAPLHPGIETITLDPIASQLLEAACGFTVLLDEQGHLRYTSPSMEASLGAKVLTSQGDPRQVFDCIHPEDMPTARELLAGVLTAGNVAVSFSLRVRAQGGKWRRLEGTARNLLDHPIIRSILVSCRDVTERWEARDELQRFKDFHTTVLEELAEGIVVADAHGHIVYVNPAAAHMVGKTPQNLVGSSELELLPGDQRDLVIAANERRRMGQIDRYEVEVERPDGRRIPVLISGRALTEEGRFAGTLAVLTNVEDLVSARQEAALLSLAVEQSSEYVIITDARGIILYVNPAFERGTGLQRQDVIGKTPANLSLGTDDRQVYQGLVRTIRNGQPWEGMMAVRTPSGKKRDLLVSVWPLKDSSGRITHFVGVERDITEELQRESRLAQAEKMETLGRFAAFVAHDFRNLLSVIETSLASMAARAGGNTGVWEDNIATIRGAVRSADDLICNLLGFARRAPMRRVRCDLNEVISDAEAMVRRLLPPSISMTLDLSSDPLPVYCDKGRLQHVLLNLCLNARDAMMAGGELSIRTGAQLIDEVAKRKWPWAFVGRAVFFSVTDTGCGIDPEVLENVFDPFFTSKGPERGAGLGLASVLGTARQHDGFVHVASKPGEGSAFTVYLPLSEVPCASGEDEIPTPRGRAVGATVTADRGTRLVIIADDLPEFRSTAAGLLSSYGFQPKTAANWEDLWVLLNERSPDGILLDWNLGGEPDLAAVEQLLECGHRVFVITGEAEDARQRIDAPVFQKPFDWEELLRVLEGGYQ